MGRKQKKYHYIYKTTCGVNGKYYIGMHSTDNLEDDYLGSGKRLWYSINYHGRDKHTKEILEFCENREQLKKREEEIVNEQLINEDLCMNLKTGGEGGFTSEEHREAFIESAKKQVNLNREKTVDKRNWLWENDDIWSKKLSKTLSIVSKGNKSFSGKQHTEETKRKMSESMKGKGKGETNSQFGTCWITKGGESKKIKKELLTVYQVKGWTKGRK